MRWLGLKPSLSFAANEDFAKGEYGSASGSRGGAGEIEICGRQVASMAIITGMKGQV